MTLNDDAVVIAAQGFLFTAPTGTPAPSPKRVDEADPQMFGCQVLKFDTSDSSDRFKLSVGGDDTDDLAADAAPEDVQDALEDLSGVGANNVYVDRNSDGLYLVTFCGNKHGQSIDLTVTTEGDDSIDVDEKDSPLPWRNMGHTSRDDMPDFGTDGGDTSIRGSWQKQRLREAQTGDPIADYVTINLERFDKHSLELYYGKNNSTVKGEFGVSGKFIPVEYALLILVVDGENTVGFHASKASFTRDDGLEIPVDDLATLPVKASFLDYRRRSLYSWISLDLLG